MPLDLGFLGFVLIRFELMSVNPPMATNVPAVRELPQAVGRRCGCTEPHTVVLGAVLILS